MDQGLCIPSSQDQLKSSSYRKSSLTTPGPSLCFRTESSSPVLACKIILLLLHEESKAHEAHRVRQRQKHVLSILHLTQSSQKPVRQPGLELFPSNTAERGGPEPHRPGSGNRATGFHAAVETEDPGSVQSSAEVGG